MIPIDGQVVLTAKAMRAAEQVLFDGGMRETALMQRAGEAVAQSVARLAAGREVLVLCGPGNNGGDGYVAAASLRRQGLPVRVTASGEPRSESGRWARSLWEGGIETLDTAGPAPVWSTRCSAPGFRVPWTDRYKPPCLGWLRRLACASRSICPAVWRRMMASFWARSPLRRHAGVGCREACPPAATRRAKMGHVRLLDIGVPVDGGTRVWPNHGCRSRTRRRTNIVAD